MNAQTATGTAPFSILPLQRKSLVQRVLRRDPPDNAWIEVNNLLATTPEVRAVRPEQVARIAEHYGVSLRGAFCARLEQLYREYLIFCLADHRLTSDEMADLAHLKRILRLHNRALAAVHEEVARSRYARKMDELLVDAGIHPEEREFLFSLQQCLAMPGRVAERSMRPPQGPASK